MWFEIKLVRQGLITPEQLIDGIELQAAVVLRCWEREQLRNGSEVIHMMTADIASVQSYVDCHNKLETSDEIRARRDGLAKEFRLGDLMGAVVTTISTA